MSPLDLPPNFDTWGLDAVQCSLYDYIAVYVALLLMKIMVFGLLSLQPSLYQAPCEFSYAQACGLLLCIRTGSQKNCTHILRKENSIEIVIFNIYW